MRIKQINQGLLILFSFLIVFPMANAVKPYFVNVHQGDVFSLTEHQLFTFFVEGDGNHSNFPLNFTYGKEVGNLISFDLHSFNETFGIINFTPGCTEIGDNQIILIVRDSHLDGSMITANFNVINVNDPPNITSYSPQTLHFNISEGNSSGYFFNITANDPDLPYGDSLNHYWFLDNKLNYSKFNVVYSNFTLKTGYCEPNNISVKLLINDSYGLFDSVIWTLNITNVNRAPTFDNFNPLPDLTWPEDNYLINNFSLFLNHFNDSDYYCENRKDNFSFNVLGNDNISVIISQDWPFYVSFYPNPNFNGNNSVIITVSDGYTNVSSNVFLLNVTPVSDYPIIEPIPDQDIWAYADFSYQVNATDPDGQALNYFDNTTIFNIGLGSGLIKFLPNINDVGIHDINISVADVTDLKNSTNMKLTVHSNYPPYIYQVPNQTVAMDKDFKVQINTFDVDGNPANIFILTPGFIKTWSNDTTANFSFKPFVNGTINVSIIAYDSHRAYNTSNFFLNVSYFNFPPNINVIPSPQIAKIGEEYNYTVVADDGNGGKETLTYYDNTSLFDIQQDGSIIFIPSPSDAGNHSVNITVCDDGNPIKCSSVFVDYFVTYNRPPIVKNPGNFTIFEDELFTLQINASDPDLDPITFKDNVSFFEIGDTGLIDFTPDFSVSGKNYSVQINVTDISNATTSVAFQLNIANVDDPPYFNPNLTDMAIWNNIYEDNLTVIFVNVTDEEHETINFTLNFLLGSKIFNLTVLNASDGKALINFTPTNDQIGNYTIMINISDGKNNVSQNVSFYVHNVNDPPEILLIYPTGRLISQFTYFNWSNASDSRYPGKTTQINISEGNAILFNQTSIDVDSVNLTYYWYFNGVLISNSTFLNYSFGYDSPREAMVVINISDPQGASDVFHWDTLIRDVNRAPVFGSRYDNTEEKLQLGTFNNTVMNASGAIVLLPTLGNSSSGTFISRLIDMQAESRLKILNFASSFKTPPGTMIKIFTATSPDKNDLNNWSIGSSSSNFTIESTTQRYFKYKVLLTTNNVSRSPSFSGGIVSYILPDATIKNNNVFASFFDLDDYFYDFDPDDTLSFSYTGANHMAVSIDDNHNVRIEPDGSYVGKDALTFHANDGEKEVDSNEIIFDILPGTGSSSSSSSSSSSTSIVYQTQIQKEKETVYSMFDLLSPSVVTVYKNETVAVPITLANYGNKTLYDVYLNASSESDKINFTFSKTHFNEFFPGDKDNTTLFATPYKIAGTYEIVVHAHVNDPDINDSVKIMINSREKGEQNSSQINTKIAFTQDILSSNPACYELNEILDKARQSYVNKEYGKAESYLEKAVHDCRYLVSHTNATIEVPQSNHVDLSSKESMIYAAITSFTVIMALGMFLLYKKT